MTLAEQKFQHLARKMEAQEGISLGPMMSSPGIKKNNKVFAFFYQDTMCFRLGKGFNPENLGIKEWSYLSPFKNKPPMKGWYIIPVQYSELWKDLAEQAADGIP